MNNIEQNICKAIDIIVGRHLSQAGYDKTIQATVIKCVDATIGKYKVQYQDSTFYAYSGSPEITYPDGSNVYVLVPSNNMSNDKTILGMTKRLGINYIPTVEAEDAYDITGVNVVEPSTAEFGLSSYREGIDGTYTKLLYSCEYDSTKNLIDINSTSVEQYIKKSGSIICGATMRTDLAPEQRVKGNYGIIFALDFKDNSAGDRITRYYTIDINKITGNPYKLINPTRQIGIFDIDNENFERINYIAIFTQSFPITKSEEECIEDIFISNVELYGAERISGEALNSYSLNFVTLRGTYFVKDSTNEDYLTLDAQVKIKGKVVDDSSQDLQYYWFVAHAGITSQSMYYNSYGGQGWKCLNDYNVIESDESGSPVSVEWVPGSYRHIVRKREAIAKETTFKCAVVYNGNILTRIIVITNFDSDYELSIVSDDGQQFYFDNGHPTLTCLVNGVENLQFDYAWSVTSNIDTFESLGETIEQNEAYHALVDEYENLLAQINAETLAYTPNEARLNALQTSIAAYDELTRVEKNKIYHLNINAITNFSTYQCTVYKGGVVIGTASIVIRNTLEVEGTYTLVINNGSYVYKYDESGNAPNHESKTNPLVIQALGFTVYDNLGRKIDDDVIRQSEIRWTVPSNNSMIRIPSDIKPTYKDEVAETDIYTNLATLMYDIESRYHYNYKRNDIELTINYKGTLLAAKTNLTFTKDGEAGTNGTEYTCRVVPSVRDGDSIPAYPMTSETSVGVVSWNFTPKDQNQYFKVQLWHNEEQIYSGYQSGTSTEGRPVTIAWDMLSNKYTSEISDESGFSVNATNGVIGGGKYSTSYENNVRKAPVNILRATVTYDDLVYYATLPIVTAKTYNNNYRVKLKEGSGFNYAVYSSDGRTPKYDNTTPFEIIVERNLGNNQWENVSLKTTDQYKVTYVWNYLGSIYADKAWRSSVNLVQNNSESAAAANQKWAKPVDDFDGHCLSNAVECIVLYDELEVCRIHLPVHLMLNQYGHAQLNGWDGNNIQLSEEGGFILAPQVGAGRKETDNSFTGVLMGEAKEGDASKSDVGLLGYYHGKRTIFLDSETGKAEFGLNGQGKIVIDPTTGKAQLYSGNYSTQAGTGLMIDLTTPEIRYGNGAFIVDKDGHLTAKGGGTLAGWNIDNDSLFTGLKTSANNARISSADFTRTINGVSRGALRIALGTKFAVSSDGTMYAGDAVIGTGTNKITIGRSYTDTGASAIFSGSKNSFTANSSGFYLGTDGIALGSQFTYGGSTYSNFQVDNRGNMVARTGFIGNGAQGWSIQSYYLVNGAKTYYNDTAHSGVFLGTTGIGLGSGFYVSAAGSLYAASGNIGGWSMTTAGLSRTTSGGVNFSLGSNGLAIGETFKVSSTGIVTASGGNFSGTITATGGKIGKWTITNGALFSEHSGSDNDGVILRTDGTLVSSGTNEADGRFKWKIRPDGSAIFNTLTVRNNFSFTGGVRSHFVNSIDKIEGTAKDVLINKDGGTTRVLSRVEIQYSRRIGTMFSYEDNADAPSRSVNANNI